MSTSHSAIDRALQKLAVSEASFRINEYQPQHQPAFQQLNEEWLEKYFSVEPYDRQVLSNPEEYILKPGGHILIAEMDGKTVGTCALLKRGEGKYELSKMAVTPAYQGLKIGEALMQAALDKANALNTSELYLESNRKLAPALQLYRKFGFQETPPEPGPIRYVRSDIRMMYPMKAKSQNNQ